MKPEKSILQMKNLFFEKLEFIRRGEKNCNEVDYNLGVTILVTKENQYKVTLTLRGNKKEEYEIELVLTGVFLLDVSVEISDTQKDILLKKNAVAILMPYLRSQVSLLTAQPEVECQVMPPFNIAKMFEEA